MRPTSSTTKIEGPARPARTTTGRNSTQLGSSSQLGAGVAISIQALANREEIGGRSLAWRSMTCLVV